MNRASSWLQVIIIFFLVYCILIWIDIASQKLTK